jgi:hypothetical protein
MQQTKRPIKARFHCGCDAEHLTLACYINSLAHAKGTPSLLAKLRLLVGIRFQVYFTPLIGVLFTFPSRYLFTIGHEGVFSLGKWSSRIQTGFLVSRPTWDTAR